IVDPVNHNHEPDSGIADDAHFWTSPRNAIVLAELIRSALADFEPGSAGYFEKNYMELVSDLKELDRYIRTALNDIENRYLIVAHPSWGHFAEEYGLQQISIEQHGSEIKARQLT